MYLVDELIETVYNSLVEKNKTHNIVIDGKEMSYICKLTASDIETIKMNIKRTVGNIYPIDVMFKVNYEGTLFQNYEYIQNELSQLKLRLVDVPELYSIVFLEAKIYITQFLFRCR